jgi:hypothetical protein
MIDHDMTSFSELLPTRETKQIFATSCDKSKFIICSDYLLCHLATENVKGHNSFIF